MIIQLVAAVVVLWLLGGCRLTRQVAEGGVSYHSREHLNLITTVPANFGFTSKALYFSKSAQDWEVYSLSLGGTVIRQQRKSNTVKAKSVLQIMSTEIPLASQIHNPFKQC